MASSHQQESRSVGISTAIVTHLGPQLLAIPGKSFRRRQTANHRRENGRERKPLGGLLNASEIGEPSAGSFP
jgi:hypothetical protein